MLPSLPGFEPLAAPPADRLLELLLAADTVRRHGTEIDPWEDLDLTDWPAVDRFARKFAGRLRLREAPARTFGKASTARH
jgi:hypothetical protein